MYRIVLSLLLITYSAGLLVAQELISEDFESYELGSPVALAIGPPWNTWSSDPGGEEDVPITNEQAYSGVHSIGFSSPDPVDGGPGDIILSLGNTTAGVFRLRFMMFVAQGHGGSFNLQHTENPGEDWGLEVTLRASGDIQFTVDDAMVDVAVYPHDEWFMVEILVNHALNLGFLSINEGEPVSWPFSTSDTKEPGLNQWGSINYYAYAGGDPVLFYIDDVVFEDLTTVGMAEGIRPEVRVYPNPVKDMLAIEFLTEAGIDRVALLDMTGRVVQEYPGLMQRSQGGVAQVDMSTLPSGVYFLRLQAGVNETVHRVVLQ
jgi:hypothetical protein